MLIDLKVRTRWRGWFRHYATSRKVAGSIPDAVTDHWYNPSGRTVALGSTYTLTDMHTREYLVGVKAAGAQTSQPYWLSWNLGALTLWCPKDLFRPVLGLPYLVLKSGSLNSLVSQGPVQSCTGFALPLNTPRLKLEFQYGTVSDGTNIKHAESNLAAHFVKLHQATNQVVFMGWWWWLWLWGTSVRSRT